MNKPTSIPDPIIFGRLVDQGPYILKAYYEEHAKDPKSCGCEFWRGNLVGWRNALEIFYPDDAQHIVERVRVNTQLVIPPSIEPKAI